MSTTEPVEGMAEPWDELEAPPVVVREPCRHRPDRAEGIRSPGVRSRAVVAIMTFLASLTTGAAWWS